MAYTLEIEGTDVTEIASALGVQFPLAARARLQAEILSEDGSYRPDLDDEVILRGDAIEILTSTPSGATAILDTDGPHGLRDRDVIDVVDHTGSVPALSGPYVVTVIDEDTLSIPVTLSVGGSDGQLRPRRFGGFVIEASERGAAGPSAAITTSLTAVDYSQLADRRYMNDALPTDSLKNLVIFCVAHMEDVTIDPDQLDGPTLPDLAAPSCHPRELLDRLATLTGWVWELTLMKTLRMYEPGTVVAPFNLTAGDDYVDGDVTVEPSRQDYANRVIVYRPDHTPNIVVEDAGEMAAHGIWEALLTAPAEMLDDEATTLAEGYLAQSLPVRRVVKYPTLTGSLRPGDAQTMTLPLRNLSGTFLITNIDLRNEGALLVSTITAREGLVRDADWRKTYQAWSSGGSSIAVGGGGIGIIVGTKSLIFLGASAVEYVQSATPTWVDAGAIRVTIDTAIRGTTVGIITIRLRARAGTVQARLFNRTDNVSAGASSVVASAVFQTVIFAVTFAAGAKEYVLQLLPSLANVDVNGVAYLE